MNRLGTKIYGQIKGIFSTFTVSKASEALLFEFVFPPEKNSMMATSEADEEDQIVYSLDTEERLT